MFNLLPPELQLKIAIWRFSKIREDFYRETRLDIDKEGLRNNETLIARVEKQLKRNRSRGVWTWPVYAAMLRRLRAGDNFASAMRAFIPHDEYTLLEISSVARKDDAVSRGFELAEMSALAKNTLKSAVSLEIAYPMLIIVFVFLFSMLFGGEIFPDIVDLKPVAQWTAWGQAIYAIDTFNFNNWPWIVAALAASCVGYFATLRRWGGPARTRLDAMPFLYRNHRDMRAAMLLVSFAGLLDSGVTLRQAIATLVRTADPWMRWHLAEMDRRLTAAPDQPMRALDTGLFSIAIVDKVTDAAGRDQFEEAIKHLGRHALDEIVTAIKRNAKRVHLMMLGFAGLLFLCIAMGSYVATGLAAITAFTSVH